MNLVERRAEAFARRIDRRTVLRGAAAGIFATVTGAVVGPVSRAYATGPCPNPAQDTICHPPGPFCTAYSSSYCSGANCAGGCTVNRKDYPDGCWCTRAVKVGSCTSRWYKCCDCYCGGRECGCYEYHDTYSGCVEKTA